MTSEIPARRTGLIVFFSRILSVFTGLLFLVLMARSLSITQFGLWAVILDLVAFAGYPSGLIVFWATRDVARGARIGKTAVAMNTLLSVGGVGIYVLTSLASAGAVRSDVWQLLFASVLVPLSYWNQAANALVSGHRPSALGASLLVSEFCKLGVGATLLLVYNLGLTGVILAVAVSYFSQAVVSTYLVRDVNSLPFDLAAGKRWLSRAWLPALMTTPSVLAVSDSFLASVISGGTSLAAYYQAAFSIASVAGYSLYLTSALYPLLLRGGSDKLVNNTLELLMLFGFPMAVGAAVLAQPLLALLKSQYVLSSSGLVILSFAALFSSISLLLDQTLLGRERTDAQSAAGVAAIIRSDLFFVSIVNIAMSTTYLATTAMVVLFGVTTGLSQPQIVILWGGVQLSTVVASLVIKLRRVRRNTKLFLSPSFYRYVIATGVMGLLLEAVSMVVPVSSGTFGSAVRLAVVGIAGLAAYFGVLYAIDSKFRVLVGAIMHKVW